MFLKTFDLILDILNSMPYVRSVRKEINNEITFSKYFTHELMIADKIRCNAYNEAIQRQLKKNDVIIDLGTGTGILSFYAANNGCKKIYAIDESDFIYKAKSIAEKNGFDNIHFIRKSSTELMGVEEADAIVHEQIGDGLFNENMIEKVTDLRDRLLKPGGKIIPSKFEFYMVPVKLKDKYRVPFLYEHQDFCFTEYRDFMGDYDRKYMYMNVHDKVDCFLSKPFKAFSFDLKIVNPKDIYRSIEFTRTITKKGRLDGVVFFFKVYFDDRIIISTSPFAEKTHWGSLMLRCESREFTKGDTFYFQLNMKNLSDKKSWRWNYEKR